MSIDELSTVKKSNEITFDDHEFEAVARRYGQHYDDYLFNPLIEDTATDRLLQYRDCWSKLGATVVLTSGVYDLIHLDHKGYLLHTKLAGAATHYDHHYGRLNRQWKDLSPETRREFSDAFLESGELRLVVSVDGDNSVSNRKGGISEKGHTMRPITDWLTRARSVVDVTVPIKSNSGWARVPVVDAVTVHGPDDFALNHPHANLIDLASILQPNVWTVFEESQDIIDAVRVAPQLGSVALRCIHVGGNSRYFTDSFLGKFSTTAILKRAQGTE